MPVQYFTPSVKADEIQASIEKNNPKPFELIEKRTETSKTYDNGDGTFTNEIYPAPVHFKENDKWIDIDSNIIMGSDGKYKNKANKFKISFSKDSKQTEFTSFDIDGKSIKHSFNIVDKFGQEYYTDINDVVPTVEGNKITYKDIFNGVDIRQTVVSDGLKEDIIIKEYKGKNSFVFKINMTGVEAVKESDGSISFYDKTNKNEVVFTISKPVMMDSNIDPGSGEAQRSEDIYYELTQKDSNIYLSIIADKNWLESSDRVYPVYIDPSTSASPTGDAYVTDKYPTSNFNSDWNSIDGYYQLKSGYYDSTTGTNYSYIKFDLSSVSGKLVTAASLNLYCNHSYYATIPNAVWIDTVNSAWDQSTHNWYNKPGSTFLTTGNAVRDTWASFDVTKAVAGWASYPAKSANYGFKIHENGNGQTYWKKFRSMGNSSGNPYVSITYSEIPAAPTATMFTNNDGSDTRFVNLAWSPVAGATGYKVAIFNGKDYEYFDVPGGNTTSWTSYNKKIWPTTGEISQGRYLLHNDGLGDELPYDPNSVYVNSNGSYTNAHHYYFRVKAYNANGESNVSAATVVFFPRNDDIYLGDEGYYSSYDNRIGYGISKTNIANGNLFLNYNDINIDGRGLDLAANRSFNSLDNSTGILGMGWRLSYEMNLQENTNGDVLFTGEDGSRHIFNKNSLGYYHAAGVFLDLIKNTGDNTYTMTDRGKTVYEFNAAGKLVGVKDNNGNTLSIVYDASGKISKVVDAVNRELTFSYGTNTVTITDPAERKIEYTLTNGVLVQVKYLYKDQYNQYQLDKSISYSYGADETLTVTNPNGDNVLYRFSGGRLNSFTKDLTLYSNDNLNGTLYTKATTFDFDSTARTTTVIYPIDSQRTGTEKYIYNTDGTLKSKIIYPEIDNPITYSFQYNANLQLTREYNGKGNETA